MTQRWWEKDDVAFADLVAGLSHLNRPDEGAPHAEYRNYAYALMQFANGYNDANRRKNSAVDREAKKVKSYVRACATWTLDNDFLSAAIFRHLLTFQPMIASDEIVREIRERIRRLELTAEEIGDAQESHRKLVDAVAQFDAAPNETNRSEVGWCLGQLFYIVRCNLDHSEKTPFGPDVKKAKRDTEVLSVILPVLREVVLRTLDNPNTRLAVYGTLRSGEPNHRIIADLGNPVRATIPGEVRVRHGFPSFTWRVDSMPVEVELYSSPRLTSERWDELDEFEGADYRRVFAPASMPDGSRVVATIYVDAKS